MDWPLLVQFLCTDAFAAQDTDFSFAETLLASPLQWDSLVVQDLIARDGLLRA